MPESSLWGLIIGLILLALGLTFKSADLRHTLKRIRDELSAARSEISSLNERQQKQIQDIEMGYQARIDELSHIATSLRAEMNHMAKDLSDSDEKLKKVETDYAAVQQRSSEFERLSIDRKFMLDVKEKEIAALSKPIEPASASSEPGPNDYHTKRRKLI